MEAKYWVFESRAIVVPNKIEHGIYAQEHFGIKGVDFIETIDNAVDAGYIRCGVIGREFYVQAKKGSDFLVVDNLIMRHLWEIDRIVCSTKLVTEDYIIISVDEYRDSGYDLKKALKDCRGRTIQKIVSSVLENLNI